MTKIKRTQSEEVSLLIENEVLLPMRSAVDTLGWLETLAKTIRDTANAPIDAHSDHTAARLALMRIASLAEVAGYIASDFSNFVDCAREGVEDIHLQTIINAAEGQP